MLFCYTDDFGSSHIKSGERRPVLRRLEGRAVSRGQLIPHSSPPNSPLITPSNAKTQGRNDAKSWTGRPGDAFFVHGRDAQATLCPFMGGTPRLRFVRSWARRPCYALSVHGRDAQATLCPFMGETPRLRFVRSWAGRPGYALLVHGRDAQATLCSFMGETPRLRFARSWAGRPSYACSTPHSHTSTPHSHPSTPHASPLQSSRGDGWQLMNNSIRVLDKDD